METQNTDLFAQTNDEQTEVLTPVVITETVEEETTSEVAKIVKESGIEQTKGQMILQAFTAHFNKLSEIEKELNSLNKDNPSKEEQKKARRHRLDLVKDRGASKEAKEGLKRGIIIEGRLIDSVFGVHENSSKLLEDKFEGIEKFEENQEKKRVEALRLERIELLKPFGIDVSFINLSEMPDEKFEELYNNSKMGFEGKALLEKKQKEDKERIDSRMKTVSSIGLIWNNDDNSYLLGDINVSMVEIKCDEDAAFNTKIENIKAEIERRANELAETKRISELMQIRVNQLSSIGMKYNDLEERYEYDDIDGEEMSITIESLRTATDDLFEVQMVACKATIDIIEENKVTLYNLGKERQQLMFDIGVNVDLDKMIELDTDGFSEYHSKHKKAYDKKVKEDALAAASAESAKKQLQLLQAKEQAIKTKAENFGKRLIQEFGYKKDSTDVAYSKQGYDVTVEKLKQLTEDEFLQRINEVDEKIKAKKAARKALLAPDKEKVQAFLKEFQVIVSPEIKDEQLIAIVKNCLDLRDKIVIWGNEKMEAL